MRCIVTTGAARCISIYLWDGTIVIERYDLPSIVSPNNDVIMHGHKDFFDSFKLKYCILARIQMLT